MKQMMQIACVTITLLIIALVSLPSRTAATSSQRAASETRFIDALDDCIQQRFIEIDQTFGMRRIMRAGDTPHRFKPENARELASVSELNNQGINVALYLASRSVLGDKPDEKEWAQDRLVSTGQGDRQTSVGTGTGFSRRIIKGPVLISAKEKDEFPLPTLLWEQSRKAMLAFATTDSFEFTLGNWKFAARPVRASEPSCLQCHLVDSTAIRLRKPDEKERQRLKIGDPLGVVLYAYRESK